jgi:uncharacterized DUF497 family protein
LDGHQYQFEWDEVKAASNARKHGVSFDLAATIFHDPRLISLPDLEHSEAEDRWFSIGLAGNGEMFSVVYRWWQSDPATTTIRLISARPATATEVRHYQEMP